LYPPQTRLFLDICGLILGPGTRAEHDPRQNCLWIFSPGRGNISRMKKITPQDLGLMLLEKMTAFPPAAEVMAEICRKVFLAEAFPARSQVSGKTGIRIETGMENFRCIQCGRCCRVLDYRHEVCQTDYLLWQQTNRSDILERVATISRRGKITSYAVWVEPGTRKFSDICPWLAPADPKNNSGMQVCRIHDVKPEICRQYPGTRKHAEMTGCGGFAV
ncbi:MAG: YkgJ family cysteine cluster protein, partial [Desulfosalsimonas sp.]